MKYHKINSIFQRDKKTKKFTDEYSCDEFWYLRNNEWIGTEKIDGTNIRFVWDGEQCTIGGRTDNAHIPATLLPRLQEIEEKLKSNVFRAGQPMTVFGEGYGAKIQQGESYIPDGVDFIMFDIAVGDWWLKRQDVTSIAKSIGVNCVPVVFRGSLSSAIDMVKSGFKSCIGNAEAEGLVLVPALDIKSRNGDRIITKVKARDYR